MPSSKHKDTTVSLAPLAFDEAIAKLAQAKRKGSQAGESGNTTELDPESAPSTEQTAPVREAPDD